MCNRSGATRRVERLEADVPETLEGDAMRSARTTGLVLALAGLLGFRLRGAGSPARRLLADGAAFRSGPALERVNPQDAARLRRVIEPLARAADKPPAQVKVGILSDNSINAANAGGGEFYVTRGLLDRATDEQLLAIMAHEVAHNDLGHVAKAQAVNTGVGIGAAILEQVIPQAAIITPIAGTLITRAHSRSEELAADKHAVTLRGGWARRSSRSRIPSPGSSAARAAARWGVVRDAPGHQRPHPGAARAPLTLDGAGRDVSRGGAISRCVAGTGRGQCKPSSY